ncbi:MAG: isochorismate synthase [Acidimicrobiales bacterium]|nr:isochorismate synthase [Acidimicrobiales bacterium]
MGDPTHQVTTRRLDDDVDLLAFAGDHGLLVERDGVGLAGRGVAAELILEGSVPAEVATAFDHATTSFDVDDEVGLPGCGLVAFGALPFLPGRPRTLTVPEVLVGRGPDGTRWLTHVVANGDRPAAVDLHPPTPTESELDPGEIRIRSARDPRDWCAALAQGRDTLGGADGLRKFVLAREITVDTDRPLSRSAVLGRLRRAYPGCYLTSVGPMVGASPELLLSRSGDIVRSRPMAGTAPRSADPTADARLAASLLASSKDREEHQITIDMVRDTLLPWCSYLDAEPEPSIVAMANVQHLATYVEGRLSTPAASALELVTAVHPTPAVCGSPTAAALELIDRLEDLDRGAYAGPVGWVDHRGNGEWAVGIRSAELSGTRARVFAGVGVVADSDPDAELAETRAKLQAILSALLRP